MPSTVSSGGHRRKPFYRRSLWIFGQKRRLDRVVHTAVRLMMTLTTSRNLMNFEPALTAQ